MIEYEIQNEIDHLQKQIELLEKQNAKLNADIEELEECISGGISMMGKWETALSDCYENVKAGAEKLASESRFRESYINSINSILSGKDATAIGECFQRLKNDPKTKIEEIKNDISENNKLIIQYQSEIDELRLHLCD